MFHRRLIIIFQRTCSLACSTCVFSFIRAQRKCSLCFKDKLQSHFRLLFSAGGMWYHESREATRKAEFSFDERNYEKSFYCAMKPGESLLVDFSSFLLFLIHQNFNQCFSFSAIRIGKVFGLFPIEIDSKNPNEIRFKWRALKTFFSIIFIIGSFLTTCVVLKSQTEKGPLTASNIVGIIFFSSCCTISILFFKISQRLRLFMVHWTETESFFTCVEYQLPPKSWTLKKRILVCTILYVFLSTLEHVCYQASEIFNLIYAIQVCKPLKIDFAETFIGRHLSFIVEHIPFRYNHFIGFVLEYLNFSYTFFWNFLDLFIILISIGIKFLFEEFNSMLQNYRGLLVNETVWADIRFHYIKICELLKFINNLMGESIVLACFIDGYFILVQLLNITT